MTDRDAGTDTERDRGRADPSSLQERERSQRREAEGRIQGAAKHRLDGIELIRKGNMVFADTPERVAARVDRLSRHYADVRPIDPGALAAREPGAVEGATAILERIINEDDLLDVRYLEGGAASQRAVGRVNIRDDRGRVVGYGTGSLVSPSLLLTNHHVLPDVATAAASSIEFDYQDGLDGRPLAAKVFGLDPGRFFLASEELDFALVAVDASAAELAGFGHNPLIAAEGKAIVGDFVSIIQHPGGEKKQVALRENRLVDVLEDFVHYETDTEPGSSGSPVFNDQWEFVALHHASVRVPEQTELGGIVNEGVRVSRLVAFIQQQSFGPAPQLLVDGLWAAETPHIREAASIVPAAPAARSAVDPSPSMTIPVEITVAAGTAPTRRPGRLVEAVTIDPDYAARTGFQEDFLGEGSSRVALPTLSDDMIARAAIDTEGPSEPAYVLDYHHFSVVLEAKRRLAIFTAVNIDGATSIRLQREPDRWFLDPRIPEDQQTGEEIYANNDLDRGHIVRRLDPAWGASDAEAKRANDDTFHFTNCSPQHEDFNQNQTTWAGLEDYILENAENLGFRVSVFSGPVLHEDDDAYRGVQLPRQFWKVVAMVKQDGSLSATAYLLSQAELIKGLELVEEFSYGEYETFQVPIRRIEADTGLSFGSLKDADPLEGLEAVGTVGKTIERLGQVTL